MRYQDYVIKDGEFIGNFENMYQDFDDPWHQKEMWKTSYNRAVTPISLKRIGVKNVLEVGCGLGFFSNYLSTACPDICLTGMDISKTAILKARETFPKINFVCANISEGLPKYNDENNGIINKENGRKTQKTAFSGRLGGGMIALSFRRLCGTY